MNSATQDDAWEQALHAAAIFAVDPSGTGVVLHGAPGPARDDWLSNLRDFLPNETPMRRVPSGIGDERLLGGLDLAATLRAGRPVVARGLLAESNGGVLVIAMAERLAAGTAARLAAAMDDGEIPLERDGVGQRLAARVGLVALDEGRDEDEAPPAALADRLAMRLDLDGRRGAGDPFPSDAILAARADLPRVAVASDTIDILVNLSLQLGIPSLRAPLHALHVARIAAALRGSNSVADEDIQAAVCYVLLPRATVLPVSDQDERSDDASEPDAAETSPPDTSEGQPPETQDANEESAEGQTPEAAADVILAAALAALPPGLLARLQGGGANRQRVERTGRAGPAAAIGPRGRPIGTRHGDLRSGRLALVDTLRSAAPRQALRRRDDASDQARRVIVTPDDFRIRRFRPRRETTAIFVVDASGSAAVHRLAEVKGAIELLLADCYVRRDSVALVAFRGTGAEVVLPPTRSLTRAKKLLAGLPGGGGTPVSAGLEAALELADRLRRKGRSPFIVLMTDGRANVARGGRLGRAQALQDALDAGRQIRAARIPALAIDTAPLIQSGPDSPAHKIGDAMAARTIRLPQADSAHVSQAVRAAIIAP